MNRENGAQSDHDQRLDEVVTAYLKDIEMGRAPNRPEWLARHPDLAVELVAFFAAQDRVEKMAAPFRASCPVVPGDAATVAEAPTPSESPAAEHLLGTVRYFGDYELLEETARGGMGVVYKARQVSLKRIVALKMILAGQFAGADDVRRFHTEAEAAAHLDHPGIVPIHEIGEYEGQHYYSMQFVDGPSLAQRLDGKPWSNRDAAQLVRACAEAVHYAHERGVIHRDIKPANILLQIVEGGGRRVEGENLSSPSTLHLPPSTFPKIADFGLAKRAANIGESGANLTQTGQILGTPAYMAPEQASPVGKTITAACDVYSLGAVLYVLLAGRPPFQAASVLETLRQVAEQEPEPPGKLNPQTARDLETICLKCLEKRPELRYSSAQELADDLGRFLNYEPIRAKPAGPLRHLGQWFRQRPWRMASLAGFAVVVLALLAYGLWTEMRQRGWESLYDKAQNARLRIAPPPPSGKAAAVDPLSPAGERALALLRQAAEIRPDPRLYDEALDVLLSEGRGGERIYPKPGQKGELPAVLAATRKSYGRQAPHQMTRDAKLLLFDAETPLDEHSSVVHDWWVYRVDLGEVMPLQKLLAKTGTVWSPSLPGPVLDRTGKALAVLNRLGGGDVIELATGKVLLRLDPSPARIRCWQFSPDGAKFAVVTDALEVWDVWAGRRVVRIPLPDDGWKVGDLGIPIDDEVGFTTDSMSVTWKTHVSKDFPGCSDFRVFSVDTGKLTARIRSTEWSRGNQPVALSPDATILARAEDFLLGTSVAAVDLFSVGTGERLRRLACTDAGVVDRIAFSPDGKLVIAAHTRIHRDERAVKILVWEAATGQLLLTLPGRVVVDGFGPHGEVAIVRAQGEGADSAVEVDLWRLDELVPILEQKQLLGWAHFYESNRAAGFLRKMIALLLWIVISGASWLIWHVKASRQFRRNEPPSAGMLYAGAALSLYFLVVGVAFLVLGLAERPWEWRGMIESLLGCYLVYCGVFAVAGGALMAWATLQGYRRNVFGENPACRRQVPH